MRLSSLFSNRKRSRTELRTAIDSNLNIATEAIASIASNKPVKRRGARNRVSVDRRSSFECMEPRVMFNAAPIWVGGVYIENDDGTDIGGDTFYISFNGGADGTTLDQIVIDADQREPGFGVGDKFFDTVEGGLGADHAYPFTIVKLQTADPNARVWADVQDGSTKMTLHFENFHAGDVLVFQIDVDEVEFWDPSETDLDEINSGFDPITSGVEYQTTKFTASFTAPHYQDINGQSEFWNKYDPIFAGSHLNLPADDDNGLRDRSTGAAFSVTQIPKPISIAGTVFVDNNLNLVQDSGEQPLSGVQLELFRKDGNQYVSTGFKTTTNSAGKYEFGLNLNLMPGTYEVRETQPNGYYSVGAVPGKLDDTGATVGKTVAGNADVLTQIDVLLGDEHAQNLNFAEAQPSTIKGFVYKDMDNDGVRDAGEGGIGGVQIRLESVSTITGQSITLTTTTASDGSYSFQNLVPGRYRVVEVLQPVDYFDGKDTPGTVNGQSRGNVLVNDVINEIQLNGNDNGVEFNFGELPPGSISGFVGLVNPGFTCASTEPGAKTPLAGVTVQLIDINGTVIATQQTKADGTYKFDKLPIGVYHIREITPAGVIDGASHVGTISGVQVGTTDGKNDVTNIQLNAGSDGVKYDFCELPPAKLSGHAFEDVNDDGIRQSTEPMLAGVRIDLYDSNGNLIDTVTTDANGFYSFEFLGPGVYQLRETTPAGFLDGKDIVGTISGQTVGNLDGNDIISNINLPFGLEGINYDFGEVRPGSLAGRVIVDVNNNDVVDKPVEKPLGGVTVQLLDEAGNVINTTTTNANGEYLFTNLRPGRYSVHELQPTGYYNGATYAGNKGGDVSEPDFIRGFQIDSGAALTNYDFTEIPPAQIAGYVFIDNNGDVLVQPGERRLENVRVDLIDDHGTVLQTTRTKSDGSYEFTNLAPGRYAVRETQPDGYFQGAQRAGSGGGDASVVDIITSIDIFGGDNLVDYNFTEVQPAALAGKVYEDLDNDLFQDPNESSIPGVRVELLDGSGQVIAFQITDAQGNYQFLNLQPGRYSVREVQPAGYFQGGQTAPAGRADTSVQDILRNIDLIGGERLNDLDFTEVPPATISGYVFQDGAPIVNETGLAPEEIRPYRDGIRRPGDKPLANVTLELRLNNGQPYPIDSTMPGTYTGDRIRVTTDANGYFEFKGLRPGVYSVYQIQPDGYIDGLDTAGTTGGISVNAEDIATNPQAAAILSLLTLDAATDPHSDAILLISLGAGQTSHENNFSEILVQKEQPPVAIPPILIPTPPVVTPPPTTPQFPQPIVALPPAVPPGTLPDLLIAGMTSAEYTWHLSVINSGTPRGSLNATLMNKAQLAEAANMLDVYHWKVARMRDSQWSFVSAETNKTQLVSKHAFDVPEAIPLAGDFNGDGVDELAIYLEGEWLIDVNGNGRWDDGDMWAKLGKKDDLPVIGDWDGDGKDDIGVFGPQWEGDDEAIEREVGLPDSQNTLRHKPKNIPEDALASKQRERLLQRSTEGPGRSDVIDHTFRQGTRGDKPVAGDFNGDGITTVGLFKEGRWRLDKNGDGKWNRSVDELIEFGRPGDIPVVGDFDGDGVDEIAIIRGDRMIVDSNHNGIEEATDRVFELEGEMGEYVIGDFDGDGVDQAALHRHQPFSTDNLRMVENPAAKDVKH